MRCSLLTILFFFVVALSAAQSREGLGVRDSSFTNQKAFLDAKKKYPEIKLVSEYNLASVRELKDIAYCTVGERVLELDVFKPAGKAITKRPAILIIHGGGWRTGDRSQHYPLAQRLADLGYVCFTPEYRLSTEALYPAAVYDIKSAIRWVREHASAYDADSLKIAVLGFSAGGQLAALMGATNNKNTFEQLGSCTPFQSTSVQAVIDIDGILAFIHPESGEGDDSKRVSAATHWFGYSKTENPTLWKEASALTYAGINTAPFLFLNSRVARMHAGRDDFIKILSQYHIYTEVHEFKEAPHTFCLFDPWFEPTLTYIDGFLKKVFNSE